MAIDKLKFFIVIEVTKIAMALMFQAVFTKTEKSAFYVFSLSGSTCIFSVRFPKYMAPTAG